ncbi:amidohydrolase family protein [Roseivirga pacifica]|uniref:amidohydrolase family protein n=1 Tax=Roseivirga pacifica TaxID=1267423 RepID=UPI00227B9A9A|nr:amidohydrolase family protein [Roseivirga pacifica]
MKLNKIRFQLAVLLVLCMSHVVAFAQSDPSGESAVTSTYALTNATVVTAPGSQLTNATVVVKNGLIMGVGSNVSIPADAQVIDASGLYVYAAFIDGMSNTGAERPDNPERPRDLFTPDPPNDYAGITPERSVVDQLSIENSAIAQMREAGFGISNAAPYGRMLPGSTSLIILKDANHVDELVLEKDNALYAQWVGAPGAYPGNILGMMAKWRNLYTNAVNDKSHADMFAENPSGLPRPTNDRVSMAFYPVLTKDKSVMFDVDGMLEVRRAMRLQGDLGFKLIVAGVEQSWTLVDELKSTNTPIFLSLDLPKEPKNAKEGDDISEEVEALEARRMEFYNLHVGQAAELEKAGIKFGFSAKGIRGGDLKKNLTTMIEHGLSEDAALAALTTNAADILGISQIAGTVQTGKVANLMVTSAPYFTKDSQVRYMFVDGEKYEYEKKEAKKGGNSSADASGDALAGTWNYSFESPQGVSEGTFVFSKIDGGYTGVMTFNDGQPDSDLRDVSFRNGELSFNLEFDAGGQSIVLNVTGAVTGSTFDGTITVDQFDFSTPISATKDGK